MLRPGLSALVRADLWLVPIGRLALYLMSAARAPLANTAKIAKTATRTSTSFMMTRTERPMRTTNTFFSNTSEGSRPRRFKYYLARMQYFLFLYVS
jgi:hypothetical protein